MRYSQYKTVGIQMFVGLWGSWQLSFSVDTNVLRKPNRFILSNGTVTSMRTSGETIAIRLNHAVCVLSRWLYGSGTYFEL
jgi:hypothetical protein